MNTNLNTNPNLKKELSKFEFWNLNSIIVNPRNLHGLYALR